jgi:carbamoyl-phosphate synthase small subunit
VGTAPDPVIWFAVIDGGVKRNILRLLAQAGCYVRVHPITDPVEAWTQGVDAVFVGNGPGDPAALVDTIAKLKQVVGTIPTVGICLGHQLLGLALGGKTEKMAQGHRGANHPVKRHADGVVEITSMNHGFAVDNTALPEGVEETHVSLFDGSNCGIAVKGKRAFGVQYHPEASPGPQDSYYLFRRFVDGLKKSA